jgi:hypothetical protein
MKNGIARPLRPLLPMLSAALRADPELRGRDGKAYRALVSPMLSAALRADPEVGNLRFEPGSFGDFRVEEGVVTGFSRSPVHPSASGGTL